MFENMSSIFFPQTIQHTKLPLKYSEEIVVTTIPMNHY